jgi:hypothetical protein
MIVVEIPNKVVQKNGSPCSYFIGMANTDPIAQTIESIKIILSPSGIGFQFFTVFISFI